jgi:uncharacterized SAM-binding protein YcdF (DUF218 family)
LLKKIRKLLLFAITIFIVYSGLSILYYSIKHDQEQVDAAIVLGAAAWNGKPSPVLKGRIDHAISLYKEGMVNKIIFTGGKAEGEKLAESEASEVYAVLQGVKEEDILIENKSRITEENLIYTAELVEGKDLTTFVLVSDPLHMSRSMFMAKELGLEVYSSPTPNSAYKSWKTQLPFFLKEWVYLMGYQVTTPFRDLEPSSS